MKSRIDSRKLPIDARNERRRLSVQMRLEGYGVRETARACQLALGTVIAAYKAYLSGGWMAVNVSGGGRPVGSGRALTEAQENEVPALIRQHTPDELALAYPSWSRQAVAELIRHRYGVELAVRTMGLYLSRWGLAPRQSHKPAHGEPSPAG